MARLATMAIMHCGITGASSLRCMFLGQASLVSILPWILVCLCALFFIYSSMNARRQGGAGGAGMPGPADDVSRQGNPGRGARRLNGYMQLILLAGFVALVVAVIRHGHELQRMHAAEESASDEVLSELQRKNPDFRKVYTYQDRTQFSICGELRTPQEMALLKERVKQSLGLDDGRVEQMVRVHLRPAAGAR